MEASFFSVKKNYSSVLRMLNATEFSPATLVRLDFGKYIQKFDKFNEHIVCQISFQKRSLRAWLKFIRNNRRIRIYFDVVVDH